MRHAIIAFIVTFMLLGVKPCQADAVWPSEFSADVTDQVEGREPIHAKLYMDRQKIRMETAAKGQDMINIMRMDQSLSYMIMPSRQMYFQFTLPPARKSANFTNRPDASFTKVGTETINGQVTDKYSCSVDGKVTGYVWLLSGAQVVPIRRATADGSSQTDFTNVKVGPQDAALFEPPAGFHQMTLPNGAAPFGQ